MRKNESQSGKLVPNGLRTTLAYPARIKSNRDDPTLIHTLRPITERSFRVLHVIYNETT